MNETNLPPAYCSNCGERMNTYKEFIHHDKYTGEPLYQWWAKCPHYHWYDTHAIYTYSHNRWMWPGDVDTIEETEDQYNTEFLDTKFSNTRKINKTRGRKH